MYSDEEDLDEVYDGDGRKDLVDNDEISASEEAFMALRKREEVSERRKTSMRKRLKPK